nr:EF-hand calcium-binding domain-containing protein 11-like [Lytechinus pictus]
MLEGIFQDVDEDNKGFLSREDVKVAVIRLFGYKPSKFEVDELMKNIDGPGMTLNEFKSAMKPKLAAQDPDEKIRQIFVAFDSKCRGFLTLEDVEKACKLVAPKIQPHHIQKAFSELDGDGDGRVSYRDFEFMMMYTLPAGI